jgi:N-acetyl-anhydromuramyl-L-alanine amidase AmpD
MKGLKGDGIVGPMTWKKLGLNPLEIEADTDITTGATWIEQHPLPDGEYVKEETAKKWIFIHHTAGRHNPYKVIDQWGRDQRGRIGTHYVIGGQPASGADETKYDGRILQAFKDEYWAYHLGKTKSGKMHRGSISIEICSAGRLTEKDGKYYTWYKSEVHPDQVCKLETPYKNTTYFHKYSDKQIESLKALLILLSEKHDIDLQTGVIAELKRRVNVGNPTPNLKQVGFNQAFEFNESACQGKIKGLLTHGQVRTDKDDVQPQRELVNMLLTL